MRRFVVSALVMLPLLALAGGKPLPRGLEEIGFPVPVGLGMEVSDLNKIKGDVIKSGRFVSVRADNGRQLSATLDEGIGMPAPERSIPHPAP